jgi:hypothetical protein
MIAEHPRNGVMGALAGMRSSERSVGVKGRSSAIGHILPRDPPGAHAVTTASGRIARSMHASRFALGPSVHNWIHVPSSAARPSSASPPPGTM